MVVTETTLPGVLLVEPRVFRDQRGFFLETFREDAFADAIPGVRFVQDNHSRSPRGALRGLHFQHRKPQGKLIRCPRGEIFDVAVDIRPDSPHFGQWVGQILNDSEAQQLYVPPGFAHGFQVLSNVADVEYKCTDYYDPGGESGILWNDPDIGIEWPLPVGTVSDRDRDLPPLADIAARR